MSGSYTAARPLNVDGKSVHCPSLLPFCAVARSVPIFKPRSLLAQQVHYAAGAPQKFLDHPWHRGRTDIRGLVKYELQRVFAWRSFDSHCGWPSFDQGIEKGAILEKLDKTHGMLRTEIVCASCGGHLGHVFNDGPTSTGLRYCVNSLSIDFKEEKEE